jgi:hypothetical protein
MPGSRLFLPESSTIEDFYHDPRQDHRHHGSNHPEHSAFRALLHLARAGLHARAGQKFPYKFDSPTRILLTTGTALPYLCPRRINHSYSEHNCADFH